MVRTTLYDRWYNTYAGIGAVGSLQASWIFGATPGTGTIVVPGTPDWLAHTLGCDRHVVPVRIEAAQLWTGRVVKARYSDESDADGPTVELTLVDDNIWLSALLAQQVPLGGPHDQAGAETDERTGPAETVVKAVIADAATRLGLPLRVVPAPADDASTTVTLSARMSRIDQLVEPALTAAKLGLRTWMWRPGDPVPPDLDPPPTAPVLLLDVVRPGNDPRLIWQQHSLRGFSFEATAPTAYRATVGGAGQGRDRAYLTVVDEALRQDLGPYGLPEVYAEDSSAGEEGSTPSQAPGHDALAKAAGTRGVSFTAPDAMPWAFSRDWNVGDFAYARIAGVDVREQITGAELTVDDDGTRYQAVVGESGREPEQHVIDVVAKLAAAIGAQRARR